MFDGERRVVVDHHSVVERALRAWLDRPSTVFELSDGFEWHGRGVQPPAVDAGSPGSPSTPTPTPLPSGALGSEAASGVLAASEHQERRAGRTDGCRGVEVPDDFSRLLETGAEHLTAARTAAVHLARLAAVQARELAAFAVHRPADLLDRPDEQVGAAAAASRTSRPAPLTGVSEWAVDEVMAQLQLSSRAAGRLLAESVVLVEHLPATLAALEAGEISWAHAQVMVDRVGPLDDEVRPVVESELLARAAGRTTSQLREAARRAALKADASAAARRMVQAVRDRSVRVYDEDDGMASLTSTLPVPVARACYRALEAYAEACREAGDDRTKDQRMADCLADLVLGTGTDHPRVQVVLTVVSTAGTLTGGDEPGEIDGHLVPAAMVREVAYALGLLPRPQGAEKAPERPGRAASAAGADPVEANPLEEHPRGAGPNDSAPPSSEPRGAGGPGPGPVRTAPPDTAPPDTAPPDTAPPDTAPPDTEGPSTRAAAGTGSAAGGRVADLAGLLSSRSIDGTAMLHRPTVALVDELSGALLALTDGWAIRRVGACHRRACRTGRRPCDHLLDAEGLGSPEATDGYVPSAGLDGFVRARDRRCRFPGCRTQAARCDLDHAVPWPGGPTAAANLTSLCRHHHRLRHQAPGWTMRRLPDGGLAWTLPGGRQLTTYPMPYGTEGLAPLGGPVGAGTGGTDDHRPPPEPGTDDDPPPF